MHIQQASIPRVLLHGWGFTPQVWQPLLKTLSDSGAMHDDPEILTPPLPLSCSLEQDLGQLAQTLPKRAHLVGWSLGGEIALAYALHFPERVASLTLIASTPCFSQQNAWPCGQPLSLLDDFAQRLAENPVALLKRFSMLIRHGDNHAAKDRALSDSLKDITETAHARLVNGLSLLRSIDLRDLLTTAPDVSMQLIHGDADAVVPIAAAIQLSAATNATYHTLTAGSHALPLTHPKTLAHQLQNFWHART
jgi:pimeloyl-[acyl-carrier protein] methyl ester esterase